MPVTFEFLLEKYLQDTLDPDDTRLFIQMAQKKENQEILLQAIQQKLSNSRQHHVSSESELNDLFGQMLLKTQQHEETLQAKSVNWYYTIAKVAAILLIIAGAGIYFWPKNTVKEQVANTEVNKNVLPGGNKAVLTLADGSEIILNDAANGTLAQ